MSEPDGPREPVEVLPPPAHSRDAHGPIAPGSGLPENVAAGLASLLTLPSGIVFFLLNRRAPFVRFYAIQGLILGSILLLLGIATIVVQFFMKFMAAVPLIGPIINWIVGFALAVVWLIWTTLWIISTVNAFRGKRWTVPYLAGMFERYNVPQK